MTSMGRQDIPSRWGQSSAHATGTQVQVWLAGTGCGARVRQLVALPGTARRCATDLRCIADDASLPASDVTLILSSS